MRFAIAPIYDTGFSSRSAVTLSITNLRTAYCGEADIQVAGHHCATSTSAWRPARSQAGGHRCAAGERLRHRHRRQRHRYRARHPIPSNSGCRQRVTNSAAADDRQSATICRKWRDTTDHRINRLLLRRCVLGEASWLSAFAIACDGLLIAGSLAPLTVGVVLRASDHREVGVS